MTTIPKELNNFENYLKEKNLSEGTINSYMGSMKKFYRDKITIIKIKGIQEEYWLLNSYQDIVNFINSEQEYYALGKYLEYMLIEKYNNKSTTVDFFKEKIRNDVTFSKTNDHGVKKDEKITSSKIIELIINKAPKYGRLNEDELRLYLKTMYIAPKSNRNLSELKWRNRSEIPNTIKKYLLDERSFTRQDDYVFFPKLPRKNRYLQKRISYVFQQTSNEIDQKVFPGTLKHSRLVHETKEKIDDNHIDPREYISKIGNIDKQKAGFYIKYIREESKEDLQKYSTVEF